MEKKSAPSESINWWRNKSNDHQNDQQHGSCIWVGALNTNWKIPCRVKDPGAFCEQKPCSTEDSTSQCEKEINAMWVKQKKRPAHKSERLIWKVLSGLQKTQGNTKTKTPLGTKWYPPFDRFRTQVFPFLRSAPRELIKSNYKAKCKHKNLINLLFKPFFPSWSANKFLRLKAKELEKSCKTLSWWSVLGVMGVADPRHRIQSTGINPETMPCENKSEQVKKAKEADLRDLRQSSSSN